MADETHTGLPAGEVVAGGGMADKHPAQQPEAKPLTHNTAADETRTGGQPGEVIAGGGMDKHPAQLPKQGIFRVKIDGVPKTFSGRATGAELHRLAGDMDGFPVKLKSAGGAVPKNDEPYDLKPDQEFTTK